MRGNRKNGGMAIDAHSLSPVASVVSDDGESRSNPGAKTNTHTLQEDLQRHILQKVQNRIWHKKGHHLPTGSCVKYVVEDHNVEIRFKHCQRRLWSGEGAEVSNQSNQNDP